MTIVLWGKMHDMNVQQGYIQPTPVDGELYFISTCDKRVPDDVLTKN